VTRPRRRRREFCLFVIAAVCLCSGTVLVLAVTGPHPRRLLFSKPASSKRKPPSTPAGKHVVQTLAAASAFSTIRLQVWCRRPREGSRPCARTDRTRHARPLLAKLSQRGSYLRRCAARKWVHDDGRAESIPPPSAPASQQPIDVGRPESKGDRQADRGTDESARLSLAPWRPPR
jgi:hypothetical protein